MVTESDRSAARSVIRSASNLSWTTLVTRVGFEVGEYFLCLGADFGGGGDLLAADLNGDVS